MKYVIIIFFKFLPLAKDDHEAVSENYTHA